MTIFPSSLRLAGASRVLLVAVALLAVIRPAHTEITVSGSASQTRDTAIERKNEAIVQEAFEKWREGTYVFAALLAPDVV
jgi:hypothetical protein